MRLPTLDSKTAKAIKVTALAFFGFAAGLIIAVWQVPGVPEVVKSYCQANIPTLLVTVGIPTAISAGIGSVILNVILDKFFKKNIKNY